MANTEQRSERTTSSLGKQRVLACRVILAVCAILLLVACSGGRPAEPKPAARPTWCDSPPQQLGEDFVFVALSEPQESEAQARQNALKGASKGVLDYLGTEIDAQYEELTTGAGSSAEGMVIVSSIKSYIRQDTKGLVKRLRPLKWHREAIGGEGIQVCVFTVVSPVAIEESIREAAKKTRREREKILLGTKRLLQAARKMESKGKVLEALRTLNDVKVRLRETAVTGEEIDLSAVDILEAEIVGKIELQAVAPLTITLHSPTKQTEIAFWARYLSEPPQTLPALPVLFVYDGISRQAVTDRQGRASYSFAPQTEREEHLVFARIDIADVSQGISDKSRRELKSKRLTFGIKVELDRILFRPLKSDFHFSIDTVDDRLEQPRYRPFRVLYGCRSVRCYVKLFGFEREGEVIVIKDSNRKRMLAGEKRSFQLTGESEGLLTVFGIASDFPFAVAFRAGQSIQRSEFRGILKTLRESSGRKAESELPFQIR